MDSHGSIAFLAVSRIVDQTTLVERLDRGTSAAEQKAIHVSVSALLQRAAYLKSASWKEQRVCSGAFDGSVYALTDPQAIYAVSVGVRGGLYPYPPRVAWELLTKLLEATQQHAGNVSEAKPGSLAAPLMRPMKEIMRNYSEPSAQDAVTQVQQKVDGVKLIMNENVRKILETHTALDALQDKSAEMNESAVKFVTQSTNLKRQMQIRNMKIKVAMAVTVAALGAYMVLTFYD